jgi:hypothetical protein
VLLASACGPRLEAATSPARVRSAPTLPVPWDAVPEASANLEDRLIERDPECADVVRHPGDLQILGAQNVTAWRGGVALADGETEQLLDGYASPPEAGREYLLVDIVSGLALVQATATERRPVRCYDACPSFWTVATYTIPPRRSSGGYVSAVGPLPNAVATALRDGRVRRARLYLSREALPRRALPPEDTRGWRSLLWFDVDGDERIDGVERERDCGCEHVARETLVHDWDGVDWRVTERFVYLPLPDPPDRCSDALER